MRFPLLGKAAALGGVTLGLVWALGAVGGVVDERQGRLREAERGVAESLAAAQTVTGPVLQRACTETWEEAFGEGKDRKFVSHRRDFSLLAMPRTLSIESHAAVEQLHRGIFRVNSYAANARLSASWPDLKALQPAAEREGARLACKAPVLAVAVSDARGIRLAQAKVQGGADLRIESGTSLPAHPRGFHAALAEPGDATAPLRIDVRLELAGTEGLAFAPLGDETQVRLTANWPHPSFGGRFLPSERNVTAQGFDALWKLSSLASEAQRQMRSVQRSCDAKAAANAGAGCGENTVETFGVGFIDPVNPYVLSDRATKYGLLFIALTFVAVGLVEVMRRLRVHPVQYLLVGSALTVFFLLLVSLTEHMAFGWAYLVAAGACTALLAFYGAHLLRGRGAGALFGGGIAALYGALYVLLQLEQASLVLGSLLLFAVLSAVMVVTRKVDWYALMAQMRAEPAP